MLACIESGTLSACDPRPFLTPLSFEIKGCEAFCSIEVAHANKTIIAVVCALALVVLVTPRAATIFNFQFGNSYLGTSRVIHLEVQFVGTRTFLSPIDLGLRQFFLSSVPRFSMNFDIRETHSLLLPSAGALI